MAEEAGNRNPDDSHVSQIPDGLQVIDVNPPDAGQRCWVCWVTGTFRSHSFCAKLYPKHALRPGRELGKSRISKLEIRQMTDDKVVARFDRGWDILPQTKTGQGVVDLLATSLADCIYASQAQAQVHGLPTIVRARDGGSPLVSLWTSLNQLFRDLVA